MRVGEAGGCLWSRSVTYGSHALATSLPRDTGVFDKVEHWAGQVRSIDGEITELNQNLSAAKARLKFVRHRLRQKVIGRPGPRRRTCSSCEPNDASGTAVVTHSTRTSAGHDCAACLSSSDQSSENEATVHPPSPSSPVATRGARAPTEVHLEASTPCVPAAANGSRQTRVRAPPIVRTGCFREEVSGAKASHVTHSGQLPRANRSVPRAVGAQEDENGPLGVDGDVATPDTEGRLADDAADWAWGLQCEFNCRPRSFFCLQETTILHRSCSFMALCVCLFKEKKAQCRKQRRSKGDGERRHHPKGGGRTTTPLHFTFLVYALCRAAFD